MKIISVLNRKKLKLDGIFTIENCEISIQRGTNMLSTLHDFNFPKFLSKLRTRIHKNIKCQLIYI